MVFPFKFSSAWSYKGRLQAGRKKQSQALCRQAARKLRERRSAKAPAARGVPALDTARGRAASGRGSASLGGLVVWTDVC